MVNIKKILRESSGISDIVRKWSKAVYGEIMGNIDEDVRVIIDGYDYPELFEGFGVDYFIIDYHPSITGYDHNKSGFDKDGNYIVLLYIQKSTVYGGTNYNLISVLNHELKHAYQDYMRISKGQPGVGGSGESLQLYTDDFISLLGNNTINNPIKNVLKDYYYTSKLESDAFIENVYDGNTEYEKIIRNILKKDYQNLINHSNIQRDWDYIVNNYNIPMLRKYETPQEFITKSGNILKSKSEKILKRINKMRYTHNK